MKKLFSILLLVMALAPQAAHAWWNADWTERRKITLDAMSLRGVDQPIDQAVVLVRLHSGVLDFTKVARDGADLRFVDADDKTPLPFHIERFDPAAEIALVWVRVSAVTPGARKEVWLYYGSAGATGAGDSAATYDGEQSLVYHFASDAPADATANGNTAAAFSAQPIVEGLIAGGARFTPASQLRIAPSRSLAVAANGRMTFSAWIKPAEGAAPDGVIYTKLGAGSARLTVELRGGLPLVAVTDAGGAVRQAQGQSPLAQGAWAHIAVTAGQTVTLFVDGNAVATLPGGLPELGGEDVLGANGTLPGFAGDLDEVGRANTDRAAGAIALAAQTQGRASTFAQVAAEGETEGSGGHNYFGILFSALTVDAWVVIAILGVMFAISWAVMIAKGLMLGRTRRANAAFLDAYQRKTVGRGPHDGLADAEVDSWSEDSTLARLFAIGKREIDGRKAEGVVGRTQRFALAPQSVAAIRSALDAGLAREGQKLNARMVLLTIAISGGPFIGLLGTVLGVMITFAAVAAAGDVNINAIAPGIAAALLATVAGLAVAIPALFGYNYLLAQVGEIETNNLIFVDEMEKRLAETYRGSAAPAAIAAE